MTDRRASQRGHSRHLRLLPLSAVISVCVYAAIARLSWKFDVDSSTSERPIVGVLLLFFTAFGCYLLAIRCAVKSPQTRRLMRLIIWSAIAFRATMLFSVPIQEIDIYRYLWDGAASTAGVSPFRYSPADVRSASAHATDDRELAKLARLRDEQPAQAEILQRIHFAELPTIYPPTSQVVFAASSLTTPAEAPVFVHLLIMKLWFVAFDLATLLVIVHLLKRCRMPVGLCIVYAWCPLLMKEVANSGHLDAVAVFLTTLAVYLAVRLLGQAESKLIPERSSATQGGRALYKGAQATLVFVVLALGVGAKLYPIILAPLVWLALAKRFGWQRLLIPAAAFAATTFFLLAPMLPQKQSATPTQASLEEGSLLPDPAPSREADPSRGVTTFLRRWEMNDFIFLVVVENLKPADQMPAGQAAWFSVVPESVRVWLTSGVSATLGVSAAEVPFLVTRAVTGIAFLLIAIWLARRAARNPSVTHFCEAAFLTIAWFWLLCPTQNPWYWTWALPLLVFARGRAWLAVSGLVLLYYLRFWFSYHWPETHVLGTPYVGHAFFDFVVTWIEFGPWFLWLAVAAYLRQRRTDRAIAGRSIQRAAQWLRMSRSKRFPTSDQHASPRDPRNVPVR